jgi:hypothetical protein
MKIKWKGEYPVTLRSRGRNKNTPALKAFIGPNHVSLVNINGEV